MAFMPKEILEENARKLGVDLNNLTHAQKQKAVSDAMKANGMVAYGTGIKHGKRKKIEEDISEFNKAIIKKNEEEIKQNFNKGKISSEAKLRAQRIMGERKAIDPLSQYNGKTVLLSPGITPRTKTLAYKEILGDDLDISVVEFDPDTVDNVEEDKQWNTKTYKVRGKNGKKVEAISYMPKMQAMITYRPDKDLVPVAEFMGKRGYLYKHHSYPCVKQLLQQSGAYEKYKKQFSDPHTGNMFYLCGLLCSDISFTDHIIKQIEDKAAKSD